MTEEQPPVLDVRNISVGFRRRRREPLFQALDDVSLTIPRGTTMGLVKVGIGQVHARQGGAGPRAHAVRQRACCARTPLT